MPDAKDVILKHIAAVNAHDDDADPWAVDAELVAPAGAATGRDNVLAVLSVFHEAFPDLRLEVKQLLADGPSAAAEGIIAGTHDGVLHTPDGDVAPTGRTVGIRWSAVYLTDGDALKSEHLFFDQMDFLGQLGLLPAQ
jgi:predicted ester cyclase